MREREFSDPHRVLDNWSWWESVGAVQFVSDIARPFRVASMLAKERCECL